MDRMLIEETDYTSDVDPLQCDSTSQSVAVDTKISHRNPDLGSFSSDSDSPETAKNKASTICRALKKAKEMKGERKTAEESTNRLSQPDDGSDDLPQPSDGEKELEDAESEIYNPDSASSPTGDDDVSPQDQRSHRPRGGRHVPVEGDHDDPIELNSVEDQGDFSGEKGPSQAVYSWDEGHEEPSGSPLRGRNERSAPSIPGMCHDQSPSIRGPPKICYAFQNDRCTRGDSCHFRHEKRGFDLCHDFSRGNCTRGDRCIYRHDALSALPIDICRAFQVRGFCNYGDRCRYLHTKSAGSGPHVIGAGGGKCGSGRHLVASDDRRYQKQDSTLMSSTPEVRYSGICYNFLLGSCLLGDTCNYSHNSPAGVCYDFQKGACLDGDNCRYRHEIEECRAFQKGFCRNGDDCTYHHDRPVNNATSRVSSNNQSGTSSSSSSSSTARPLVDLTEGPPPPEKAVFGEADSETVRRAKQNEIRRSRVTNPCMRASAGKCPNEEVCPYSHDVIPFGYCHHFNNTGRCERMGCKHIHQLYQYDPPPNKNRSPVENARTTSRGRNFQSPSPSQYSNPQRGVSSAHGLKRPRSPSPSPHPLRYHARSPGGTT